MGCSSVNLQWSLNDANAWQCPRKWKEQAIVASQLTLRLVHATQATLEDAASLEAAVKGCSYLIHTASPVIMTPPKGQARGRLCLSLVLLAIARIRSVRLQQDPASNRVSLASQEREKLINPAITGVENALNAATKSGTVKRVVLTSSVAAVVGDNWERGANHVFTEADWNLTATDTYLPYHRWVCSFAVAA